MSKFKPLTYIKSNGVVIVFTNYIINNEGTVCSKNRFSHKFIRMTPHIDRDGYMTYSIREDNKYHTIKAHRAVASTFLKCPDPSYEVNHKDENKSNNDVSNLEWCTKDYNIHYGSSIQRMKEKNIKNCSKRVIQKLNDGTVVATFDSVNEASKATGINKRYISHAAAYQHGSMGYIWEYE